MAFACITIFLKKSLFCFGDTGDSLFYYSQFFDWCKECFAAFLETSFWSELYTINIMDNENT